MPNNESATTQPPIGTTQFPLDDFRAELADLFQTQSFVTTTDLAERIEQLRDVEARRWVSFEPLIEPIGEVDLSHIEWAVVGGESAAEDDRREMDHAWAREILQQCRRDDVAFHFKQSSASTNESGTRLTVEKPTDSPDCFGEGGITRFTQRSV
jgi:protein gp37